MKIYALFFIVTLVLIYSTFHILDSIQKERLTEELNDLTRSAKLQFDNQISFRKWNAQ